MDTLRKNIIFLLRIRKVKFRMNDSMLKFIEQLAKMLGYLSAFTLSYLWIWDKKFRDLNAGKKVLISSILILSCFIFYGIKNLQK